MENGYIWKKQNTKIVLKIKIKVNAKYDINKQNRKIRHLQ